MLDVEHFSKNLTDRQTHFAPLTSEKKNLWLHFTNEGMSLNKIYHRVDIFKMLRVWHCLLWS